MPEAAPVLTRKPNRALLRSRDRAPDPPAARPKLRRGQETPAAGCTIGSRFAIWLRRKTAGLRRCLAPGQKPDPTSFHSLYRCYRTKTSATCYRQSSTLDRCRRRAESREPVSPGERRLSTLVAALTAGMHPRRRWTRTELDRRWAGPYPSRPPAYPSARASKLYRPLLLSVRRPAFLTNLSNETREEANFDAPDKSPVLE